MTQTTIPEDITTELQAIRKDLNYLKTHIAEIDMVLTHKEKGKFEKSLKRYKAEKGSALDELKKNPVEDMKGLIKIAPEKVKEAEEIINTDIELLL
ncbi:MAG: hypothetical protein CVT88_07675 [Candidatus Altiarchaeales archaeon HGW-Altiarchaeales-1]|nr:MAG: hypothetical protein CVT88_07675 [Candidatus Altiarchaeales archaeon HGW-Altiarchaeales-1]